MSNIVVSVPPAPIWNFGTPDSPMFMLPGNQEYPGVRYFIASGETYTGNGSVPGKTETVWYRTDAGYEFPDGTTEVTFTHTYPLVVQFPPEPLWDTGYNEYGPIYTLPARDSITGVKYYKDVTNESWADNWAWSDNPITIYARTTAGYVFPNGSTETSWTHTYPTQVTSIIAPSFNDRPDYQNSFYINGVNTGAEYVIYWENYDYSTVIQGGNAVPPVIGNGEPVGKVTITARAKDGYVIAQTVNKYWEHVWHMPLGIAPNAPQAFDATASTSAYYVVPNAAEGPGSGHYEVDGVPVNAGSYNVDTSAGTVSVTVRFVLMNGYTTSLPTSWSLSMLPYVASGNPITVKPLDVTADDQDGTANDTYTIPDVTGVQYSVNGVAVAPGTYQGSGSVHVVATAKSGYTIYFNDRTTWDLSFNSAVGVVPNDVIFTDADGTASDTYEVPYTDNVVYTVNGATVAAGVYPGTGDVTVIANAAPGFYLKSGGYYSHSFYTGAASDIPVSPWYPQFTDSGDGSTGTYEIPVITGVDYLVDGVVVAAGVHSASGSVTITAVPQQGYYFSYGGQMQTYTHSFTTVTAPMVYAAAVTFQDSSGTASDTYTIPDVPNVRYYKDGYIVSPGRYPATGYVEVYASAAPGYELDQTIATFWSHTFSNVVDVGAIVTPLPVTFSDRSGSANDSYTVPAVTGVRYMMNGAVVPAGTYTATGDVMITAEAEIGFGLTPGATTSWANAFSSVLLQVIEWTNTGTESTYATFEVANVSDATGFEILEEITGRRIAYPYPVAGSLFINSKNGNVWQGTDYSHSAKIAMREWTKIAPGQTVSFRLVSNTGNLTATIKAADL